MKHIIALAISTIILSGCASNMAANGQNGPNLTQVKNQHTRHKAERYLGLPISENKMPNDHIFALYDVEARTEPSIARAAGHGILDLFTLGLWEFVGGPIEMYKGRRRLVTVEYDEAGAIVSVKSTAKPLL